MSIFIAAKQSFLAHANNFNLKELSNHHFVYEISQNTVSIDEKDDELTFHA